MSESVLIVLVNYRRADDTVACLESLQAHIQQPVTVAICDNASNDGSDATLRAWLSEQRGRHVPADQEGKAEASCHVDLKGHMRVCYVHSRVNGGFAAGNNLALRAATRDREFSYIWFLNNDTEIHADCLPALLRRMRQDPRVGICGATLVYHHNRGLVQALGGAAYRPWSGRIEELGNQESWPRPVDAKAIEERLSYVSGASMFVSNAFLQQVGPMTEDYFLFFEELDWAQRARKAGFSLGYAPDAVVFHKEGASIGTGKGAARSALAEYYGLRNKLRFTWRFFPWAWPSVWVLSWLQVARRMAQGRAGHAWLMARILVGQGVSPQARPAVALESH